MVEESIYQAFLQNGAMGLFIAYLIFDRQVLLKNITKALTEITNVLSKLENKLTH